MADDGLPIYDSRVAAAAGMFVELYRRDRKLDWKEIPQDLQFPALPEEANKRNARSLKSLHLTCPSPMTLRYRPTDVLRWCLAKKRLGLVLRDTLIQKPTLFEAEGQGVASRMHAFEASMFMLGYDLKCFSDHLKE
jgi:hypothetical protein